MTVEVKEEIKKAKQVLSFKRVAKSLEFLRDDFYIIKKVGEIDTYIGRQNDVLLLASGDPCFYGILEYFKKKNIKIHKVLPGLSSFQYMMAKLGKSWQGAEFFSFHGRSTDLDMMRDSPLSIVLTDEKNTAPFLAERLADIGMRGKIYTGYNLSYGDERIIKIRIGESLESASSLAVMVIENEMDKR